MCHKKNGDRLDKSWGLTGLLKIGVQVMCCLSLCNLPIRSCVTYREHNIEYENAWGLYFRYIISNGLKNIERASGLRSAYTLNIMVGLASTGR